MANITPTSMQLLNAATMVRDAARMVSGNDELAELQAGLLAAVARLERMALGANGRTAKAIDKPARPALPKP